MPCDQRRQRMGRLIVGAVRLERQAGLADDRLTQRPRGLRVEGINRAVAKIDARLGDHRNDTPPGRVKPAVGPCGAVGVDGFGQPVDRGHIQRVGFVGFAAGNRHLGADDIDQPFGVGGVGLGHGAKRGRAGGDTGKIRRRLAAAGHAGIKVDLGEPGLNIKPHQFARPVHGLVRRQPAPWVRSQMVAAKDQLVHGQPGVGGHARQPAHEVGRRHAGIATVLIDLIARRLDHRWPAGSCGMGQNRAQDLFVGGAETGKAHRFAGPVAGNQVVNDAHAIGPCPIAPPRGSGPVCAVGTTEIAGAGQYQRNGGADRRVRRQSKHRRGEDTGAAGLAPAIIGVPRTGARMQTVVAAARVAGWPRRPDRHCLWPGRPA